MVESPTIVALCLFAGAATLAAGGCDAPSAAPLTDEVAQFRTIGILYGQYITHYGGPPPNAERFAEYVRQRQTDWQNESQATPESLLTSPRDGQSLVIAYGKSAQSGDEPFPWIAAERTGVDGRRFAINARGGVEELEAGQLPKPLLDPTGISP